MSRIDEAVEESNKQFQKFLDKAFEGPCDTLSSAWTESWYQLGYKHGLIKAQMLGGEERERGTEAIK